MSRYQVQVEKGVFQHVDAEEVLVEAGCLVFTDQYAKVVLVLAPGGWVTVHEEESGRAALTLVERGQDAAEWRAR